MPNNHIADLAIGTPDDLGDPIIEIYGRSAPNYGVYRTAKGVRLQFSDDPAASADQRRKMAQLNPIRGEINGLIDGWRLDEDPKSATSRRVERFDRRVGDALVFGFADDVPGAADVLEKIKQDIIDQRMATARLEYLAAAFVIGLFIALFLLAARRSSACDDSRVCDSLIMLNAAVAGALGAFFSIATGIRNRQIATDLHLIANATDSGLRMVIGVVAAAVLMAFVATKAAVLSLGDAKYDPAHPNWIYVLIVGFVAGFAERLVPNILDRVAPAADTPRPPDRAGAPRHPGHAPDADPGKDDRDVVAVKDDPTEVDPLPAEAHVDNCTCSAPLKPGEATLDQDLPAASGGVAQPATGGTP